MNNMMKSLVMALSLLLLGANAYAAKVVPGNFSHYSGETVMHIVPVDTKSEAYAIGQQKLKDLQTKSSRELNDIFGLNLQTPKEKDSVTLENAYIAVQEIMNEQGRIVYRGTVNVTYHYSVDNERID